MNTGGGRLVRILHIAGWWVGHALNPKMVSYTIWGGCLNDFKKKMVHPIPFFYLKMAFFTKNLPIFTKKLDFLLKIYHFLQKKILFFTKKS